jgi:hypothetical protein
MTRGSHGSDYEDGCVSEVCTASIIRAMSEAVCRKSVETKGCKSDKAELGQTHGKSRYQAKAKEPTEEGGGGITAGW